MLFLLACVDPALGPPEAGPTVSAATYEALAAPDRDDLAARTRVARRGAFRFADGGPVALVAEGNRAWDTLPVAEADGGVRVVLERQGVRLLAWLDRDDLEPSLAAGAWIAGDGHAVSGEGAGVALEGGTGLEYTDDGFVYRFDGQAASLAVPVADGLVDEVFLPGVPPVDGSVDTRATSVRRGTRLTDDAGRLLGQTTWVWEVRILRPGGDLVLVEGSVPSFCGWDGPVVRAWVPSAALSEESGSYTIGFCCGGLGGWGGVTRAASLTLLPDQLLYDAPEGDVIGVVTEETTRPLDREAGELDGWAAVTDRSAWGEVTVWVQPAGPTMDDLAAPEAESGTTHDVEAERARLDVILEELAADELGSIPG